LIRRIGPAAAQLNRRQGTGNIVECQRILQPGKVCFGPPSLKIRRVSAKGQKQTSPAHLIALFS
jgi:hypothetical protein